MAKDWILIVLVDVGYTVACGVGRMPPLFPSVTPPQGMGPWPSRPRKAGLQCSLANYDFPRFTRKIMIGSLSASAFSRARLREESRAGMN